jgi:hypothetical protein
MQDEQTIDRCTADGGCRYLRSLALFERLAGFDLTARAFDSIAAQCDHEGCREPSPPDNPAASTASVAPIFLSLNTASERQTTTACQHVSGSPEPIPFLRAARLDTTKDESGNWIEHRPLDVTTLTPEDPLGYLYRYWRGLSASTSCTLANVDVLHLMRARIIGKMHIVNVESADPAQFSYELFGYHVPIEAPGKPSAISIAIWRDKILRDYNMARLTAVPDLQRIRAHLQGRNHHYTRLILPFFNRQRRVSHLAIAIRREIGDGRALAAG